MSCIPPLFNLATKKLFLRDINTFIKNYRNKTLQFEELFPIELMSKKISKIMSEKVMEKWNEYKDKIDGSNTNDKYIYFLRGAIYFKNFYKNKYSNDINFNMLLPSYTNQAIAFGNEEDYDTIFQDLYFAVSYYNDANSCTSFISFFKNSDVYNKLSDENLNKAFELATEKSINSILDVFLKNDNLMKRLNIRKIHNSFDLIINKLILIYTKLNQTLQDIVKNSEMFNLYKSVLKKLLENQIFIEKLKINIEPYFVFKISYLKRFDKLYLIILKIFLKNDALMERFNDDFLEKALISLSTYDFTEHQNAISYLQKILHKRRNSSFKNDTQIDTIHHRNKKPRLTE